MIVLTIAVSAFLIIGVVAGIVEGFKYGGLGPQLEEWPSRRNWEKRRRANGRLPRDSHAQAYVDGFITAEVLDDLGDMFK